MKTIYKYPLELTDEQVVALPYDSVILDVQNQGGLQLWAVVDTDEQTTTDRTIRIIGTGNPSPELEFFLGGDMEHIATVQMPPFVWHVFIDL